jgi:Cu+-exporting ATPase
VVGIVDGNKVALGNRRLLEDLGSGAGELADRSEELRRDGQTVMYVVINGTVVGLIGSPIRSNRQRPKQCACCTTIA